MGLLSAGESGYNKSHRIKEFYRPFMLMVIPKPLNDFQIISFFSCSEDIASTTNNSTVALLAAFSLSVVSASSRHFYLVNQTFSEVDLEQLVPRHIERLDLGHTAARDNGCHSDAFSKYPPDGHKTNS